MHKIYSGLKGIKEFFFHGFFPPSQADQGLNFWSDGNGSGCCTEMSNRCFGEGYGFGWSFDSDFYQASMDGSSKELRDPSPAIDLTFEEK